MILPKVLPVSLPITSPDLGCHVPANGFSPGSLHPRGPACGGSEDGVSPRRMNLPGAVEEGSEVESRGKS